MTVDGALYWFSSEAIDDDYGLHWNLTSMSLVACGEDYHVDAATLECAACPWPFAHLGAATLTSCDSCVRGFYRSGEACEACPEGAVCEGGGAAPYPKHEWWGGPGYEFFECDRGGCRGGPDFACRSGYKGRLCDAMDAGSFRIGDSQFACPDGAGKRWLLMLFFVGCVVLVWHVINNVICSEYDALDMLLLTIQQCAIVEQFNVRWPASLSYLTPLMNVALRGAAGRRARPCAWACACLPGTSVTIFHRFSGQNISKIVSAAGRWRRPRLFTNASESPPWTARPAPASSRRTAAAASAGASRRS